MDLVLNVRVVRILWLASILFVLWDGRRVLAAECSDTTVLIVGAGASAIGAANKFYEREMNDFLILEAKHYVGGRIYNAMFAGASLPLGAGWAHGIEKNHSIWQLVKKYDLSIHRDDYDSRVYRNGTTGLEMDAEIASFQLRESLRRVERMMHLRKENKLGDLPMNVALSLNGWKANSELKEAVEFFSFQFENAVKNFKTSAFNGDVTGEGTDYLITDKRGYGFVLQEESRKFSSNILLNKVVTKITVNIEKSIHQIDVADGSCYTAKHVLVTVSSGVLIENAIQFSPPLPVWKMHAINMIPMTHYCKYYLEFDRQFWSSEYYTMLVTKNVEEYCHIQNFKLPTLFPNKNILLITTVDEFCEKDQRRSDSEVKMDVLKVLRQAFGSSVPEPLGMLRNSWSTDPFVRGAYSNAVLGISEDDFAAVRHPVGSIWFAGEYTSEDEFGYAHGAYDSGTQQAELMLKCMHDASTCPEEIVPSALYEAISKDAEFRFNDNENVSTEKDEL